MQFRPQTILQTSGQPGVVPTSVPGQVSLQGTLIHTSTGNRILIQPPVMAGQQINLANLQGLQIRPQIQHVQQGQTVIQQGQTIVQQGQGQTLVQQGQGQTIVQQGQAATTQVIGQQGQVIQQSATNQVTHQTSQTTQVLQPQASQPTQILQQGALQAQPQILAQPPRAATTTQIVQQQTGVQQGQVIQPGLASTASVQTQPQQPAIAPAGIQLQTPQTIQQQLPAGVSIVNINGQQILIQRAPAPGSQFQNIILKAVPGQVGQVPNVIQIQAPAPNQLQQGQITASQPQVVLAPSGTGHVPQQIQLPHGQGVGQPQVLGNLNVLNDSQNVNINVNILPAQGQNSASQALQQLQQNKVQLAGGQILQPAPAQTPSTQTTPVKILPKGSPAPQAVGPAVQNLASFPTKPVITNTSLSSVNSSLQQTVTVTQSPQQLIGSTTQPLVNTVTSLPQQQQPVLNTSIAQQDILSQAAALTDIPIQGSSPVSQPTLQPQSLPLLSSASPTALSTTSILTQTQTTTALARQPTLVQSLPGIKTEQKPVLQTIQQQQAQIQMLTAAKTEQKPQLSQLQQVQSLPPIKTESNVKSEPTVSSMPQVLSTQSLPNVSPQQQTQQTNLNLLSSQSGGTVTNQKPQIIVAQPQQTQANVAPLGSAAQGLQALAANNAAQQQQQMQTVTIHHQPLQPKSTPSSSGVQHITIPAISQGSVVTTMATIRPNAPVLATSPQGSKTTTGVLTSQRNQPAPNVNIANMPHLQTLPPKAAMLVQNSSSAASTTGSQVSAVSSLAEGISAGTNSTTVTVTTPNIPTVVPNSVQPANSTSPGTRNAVPQQGVNVGNHNLLQRIQQQIKVFLIKIIHRQHNSFSLFK